MKYRICPNCDAHLDHGEKCDCRVTGKEAKPSAHIIKRGDHHAKNKETAQSSRFRGRT